MPKAALGGNARLMSQGLFSFLPDAERSAAWSKEKLEMRVAAAGRLDLVALRIEQHHSPAPFYRSNLGRARLCPQRRPLYIERVCRAAGECNLIVIASRRRTNDSAFAATPERAQGGGEGNLARVHCDANAGHLCNVTEVGKEAVGDI